MAKISYLEYSNRDYKYANDMFFLENYDPTGRFCQQSIEKRMKYFIELHGTSEDIFLLQTHNLAKLYDRICKIKGIGINKETRCDLSILTDYYFDSSRPQEQGNAELTQEMAKEAIEIMKKMNSWVDDLLGGLENV